MTLETYSNNFITTLSGNGGSIGSGTTTIHLASGTGAPSGQSRFVIGTEIIIGTISGTTLTATTRGAESTTAATHNDGSQVNGVLTAASLLASPGELTTTGDLEYMASGGPARLPIGTNTQVLTSNGTLPIWAAVPSSFPLNNEAQAGILSNATSTGDAGNRADHFIGGSLSGNWTGFGSVPSYAVGLSTVDLSSGATDGGFTQPYTPTGAFAIDFRCYAIECDILEFGVYNFDGTHYTAWGISISQTNSFTAGTVSGISTSGSQTSLADAISSLSFHSSAAQYLDMTRWFYVRISNDGAGNWIAQLSPDRVTWLYTVSVASVLSAVTGMFFSTHGTCQFAGVDFVDVVE